MNRRDTFYVTRSIPMRIIAFGIGIVILAKLVEVIQGIVS